MRLFHNVPAADLNLVLPETRLLVRTFELVQLVGTLAAAVVGAAMLLLSDEGEDSGGKAGAGAAAADDASGGAWLAGRGALAWSALGLLATRAASCYTSMAAHRSAMLEELAGLRYDKLAAAQGGASRAIWVLSAAV